MITFSSVRVTIIQSTVLLVLSLAALTIAGKIMGYSVLLGGLISVIPQAYFASRVFRESGARAIERVVRNAYIGELVKLILMGAGFGLVFALVEPLSVAGVFAGFVLTHLAGIAGLIRLQHTS